MTQDNDYWWLAQFFPDDSTMNQCADACCRALSSTVMESMGTGVEVEVLTLGVLLLASLGYMLWEVQRNLQTYFRVYLRYYVFLLVGGVSSVSFGLTNLRLFFLGFWPLAIIYYLLIRHGILTIVWWLLFFMFQKDLEHESILRTFKMTAILLLSYVIIFGTFYWVSFSFVLGRLIMALIKFIIILGIAINKYVLKRSKLPRDAIIYLLIFLGIYNIFEFIDCLLLYINSYTSCPYTISSYFRLCFCLFVSKAISEDVSYWRYDLDKIDSEWGWMVAINEVGVLKRPEDITNIPSSDIILGDEVGEGGCSVVFSGSWNGTKVAIKVLKIKDQGDEKTRKSVIKLLMSETQMLKALRHPNILQFLGFIADNDVYGIVTEFMDRGSLYQNLKDIRYKVKEEFSMEVKDKILLDICKGMSYLHNRKPKVLHRDLKSLNVLLTCDMRAKLADMGLSRIFEPFERRNRAMSLVGTPHWTAPEVLNREEYNEKADVWSFGIIVWEMVTYSKPYDGKPKNEVVVIVKRLQHLEMPAGAAPLYKRMMTMCWKEDPTERPTFDQLRDLFERSSVDLDLFDPNLNSGMQDG